MYVFLHIIGNDRAWQEDLQALQRAWRP